MTRFGTRHGLTLADLAGKRGQAERREQLRATRYTRGAIREERQAPREDLERDLAREPRR